MPAALMTATPGIWQGLCRFSVWGVAIGQNAQTQDGMFGESIGYGTRTGLRGINLGYYTAARGVGSVALGGLGPSALTYCSVALGEASYGGTQAGDVALGSQSQTGFVAPAANASAGGIQYAYAGTTPGSVLAVGSIGNERQVQNVAAGRVNAGSADAIIGSQLHATQVAVGHIAVSTAAHFGGGATVNLDGSISAPTYTISGVDYYNLGDALAAIQVGVAAAQTHYFSVNSTGGGNCGNNGATGANAIGIGKDAVATHGRSVALGTSGTSTAGTDYTVADIAPAGTVSVGCRCGGFGRQQHGVGQRTSASGTGSTAIGNGASASGDGSIAIGVGSVASDPNTLSVGSAGNERRITNVAVGVNPNDAVNVSQLQGYFGGGVQYDKNPDGSVKYTSVTLKPGGRTPTTLRNVAADVAPTDAANVGQLNAGLTNVLSQA